jgi:hypothetical protein
MGRQSDAGTLHYNTGAMLGPLAGGRSSQPERVEKPCRTRHNRAGAVFSAGAGFDTGANRITVISKC